MSFLVTIRLSFWQSQKARVVFRARMTKYVPGSHLPLKNHVGTDNANESRSRKHMPSLKASDARPTRCTAPRVLRGESVSFARSLAVVEKLHVIMEDQGRLQGLEQAALLAFLFFLANF